MAAARLQLVLIVFGYGIFCFLVVIVVVEIFVGLHGAVKATFTNAPQSQLNK